MRVLNRNSTEESFAIGSSYSSKSSLNRLKIFLKFPSCLPRVLHHPLRIWPHSDRSLWRVLRLFLPFASTLSLFLTACRVMELAGDTAVLSGKIARETVKLSGEIVHTSGKLGGAGIRYFSGRRVVKLEKEGNSYFVNVRINRKHKARLLVDTGATNVQISMALTKKMGVDVSGKGTVRCTLADGSTVAAVPIVLDEVRIGRVDVDQVDALVLVHDYGTSGDGLLGMSFLNNFRFELDTDRNRLILRHTEDSAK